MRSQIFTTTIVGLWLLPTLCMAHQSSLTAGQEVNIFECLELQDDQQIASCYMDMCDNEECFASILAVLTRDFSAKDANTALVQLANHPAKPVYGMEHEYAHIIGRTLVELKGASGDVFLTCSEDFEYGCMHGFFEQALGSFSSTVETANAICQNITKPPKERNIFFCYHGLGHGIMMANTNHPGRSLAICDSLTDELQYLRGCYQGVFHENIIAYRSDTAKTGAFTNSDMLYPCNSVDQEKGWSCYIVHATFLLHENNFHFQKSSKQCLRADGDNRITCINRFGQLSADARWQRIFSDSVYSQDTWVYAKNLCDTVPTGYKQACDDGASEHFVNLLRPDTAMKYCSVLSGDRRQRCIARIGNHLHEILYDSDEHATACAIFTGKERELCMQGNNVEDLPYQLTLSQKFYVYSSSVSQLYEDVSNWAINVVTRSSDPYSDVLEDIKTEQIPLEEVDVVIEFDGEKFTPNEIAITRGQAVGWLNKSDISFWPASDVHPTHEEYSEFDAYIPMPPESYYAFRFTKKGSWTFHDHMTPSAIGIVHVE